MVLNPNTWKDSNSSNIQVITQELVKFELMNRSTHSCSGETCGTARECGYEDTGDEITHHPNSTVDEFLWINGNEKQYYNLSFKRTRVWSVWNKDQLKRDDR